MLVRVLVLREVVKKANSKHRPSLLEKAELPRRAGWETRREFTKNTLRSSSAMWVYRYGFRLIWKSVARYCKRIGLKKPGEYEETNQHGGEMFALPTEFNMNKKQAAQLLFKCYETKKLTYDQMKVVRKMLSYAYQLKGGPPGENWSSLANVWAAVDPRQCAPQKKFILPTRIPRPRQLRSLLTTPWQPGKGMSLMDWTKGMLAFWCWGVFGARSGEDMKRIKMGAAHGVNTEEGWAWTSFFGGRCKLALKKAGTRPWRVWFTCMCPDKKHVPVPEDFEFWMRKDGNPGMPVTFHPECPVACHELILRCHWKHYFGEETQTAVFSHVRLFRKWTKKRRFGKADGPDDIMEAVFEWLKFQGVEETFDRNAGRKSLARWCDKLHIPYEESFQCHGDLSDVWKQSYQPSMPATAFKERRQSNDPKIATVALRKFAMILCNRGLPWKPQLTRLERFMREFMVAKGKKEKAFRIAHDLPSEDDDSDDELDGGFAL